MEYLLNKAEYIALFVNVLLALACALRGDWRSFTYWFGTVWIVVGVLLMKGRG